MLRPASRSSGGADLGGRRITTSHMVPEDRDLRGAGHEYPAAATGLQNFVMFWRTEPWDHAPGALFITEAGGYVARLDGAPYAPLDGGKGLLLAQIRETQQAVARWLLR